MKFLADAGAGGVMPGPLGVGGELDGHAALGDAFEHVFQVRAGAGSRALRAGLGGVGVHVVLAAVGQRGFLGRSHAGEGVGGQLLDDGLGDLLEHGAVGVYAVGADVVGREGVRVGEEVFLPGAGLDGLDGFHQRLLRGGLGGGGAFLAGGALDGVAAFLAGQAAVGLQQLDKGSGNVTRRELGGVDGLEGGEGDLLGLGERLKLRLVEQAA